LLLTILDEQPARCRRLTSAGFFIRKKMNIDNALEPKAKIRSVVGSLTDVDQEPE